MASPEISLDTPPETGFEPGSHPVDVARFGILRQKFVWESFPNNRLRVLYYTRDDKPGLFARAWFGRMAEGPPGHAHGGSIAAVLDDVMGATGWIADQPVVAARLTVNYRRMLPLGLEATVHAQVDRIEGRKMFVRGRLYNPAESDSSFADADGLFIMLQGEKLARMEELRRRSNEGEQEAEP